MKTSLEMLSDTVSYTVFKQLSHLANLYDDRLFSLHSSEVLCSVRILNWEEYAL